MPLVTFDRLHPSRSLRGSRACREAVRFVCPDDQADPKHVLQSAIGIYVLRTYQPKDALAAHGYASNSVGVIVPNESRVRALEGSRMRRRPGSPSTMYLPTYLPTYCCPALPCLPLLGFGRGQILAQALNPVALRAAPLGRNRSGSALPSSHHVHDIFPKSK